MLFIQLLVATCILGIGRFLFYSFVRRDHLFVFLLRYGGFLGITAMLHFYLGNTWTWIWIVGLPLLGLIMHTIFVKSKGFRFLKPGKEYDEYRGWK